VGKHRSMQWRTMDRRSCQPRCSGPLARGRAQRPMSVRQRAEIQAVPSGATYFCVSEPARLRARSPGPLHEPGKSEDGPSRLRVNEVNSPLHGRENLPATLRGSGQAVGGRYVRQKQDAGLKARRYIRQSRWPFEAQGKRRELAATRGRGGPRG
jgi:hypothetical protein